MKTKIISPWIHITNRCNRSCEYCFVKKDSGCMSMTVYNQINERLLEQIESGEIDKLYYRIAGGEPTLVFDEYIKSTQEMLNRIPDKLHIEILTNGTILTDKFMEFLRKNVSSVGLCVSLDSLDDEVVMNNLEKLRNTISGLNIGISTVIIKDGIYLKELAEYVSDHKYLWDVNCDKLSTSDLNMELLKSNISRMIIVLKKKQYPITTMLFNGINFHKSKGCGAGDTLVAFDIDGCPYPCQTVFNLINISPYIKEKCNNCVIMSFCGGGCKYHNKTDRSNFCETNIHYFREGGSYAISLSM